MTEQESSVHSVPDQAPANSNKGVPGDTSQDTGPTAIQATPLEQQQQSVARALQHAWDAASLQLELQAMSLSGGGGALHLQATPPGSGNAQLSTKSQELFPVQPGVEDIQGSRSGDIIIPSNQQLAAEVVPALVSSQPNSTIQQFLQQQQQQQQQQQLLQLQQLQQLQAQTQLQAQAQSRWVQLGQTAQLQTAAQLQAAQLQNTSNTSLLAPGINAALAGGTNALVNLPNSMTRAQPARAATMPTLAALPTNNIMATAPVFSTSIQLDRMSGGNRSRGSFRGGRTMQVGRTPGSSNFQDVLVPQPGQEVTVEDLLRVILLLPPHERAIDAVEQGLHCLDSSAAAALLKELSKQGQVKRAFEIFDWLRQLPQGHPLALLCDLYTYTTMIAQCGSAQQLRRALDLVAEMKARGITCNVHTYSALMNVCMKANELDVALDVFKQMQEEGVHPNLVTYNILIDVHVKKGQWDDAIGALDSIQQQGIQAEARTYNTVISACSKAGQFERALRVYQHMQAAGVEPSTTTYTAMIGVYGRVGQLEKCLEVYQEMVKRGCERNVITYSSLISACEKAGQWQVALDLYDIMRQEGCRPNTVTFNSLIAACAHGYKWEKAGELFEQMPACGCKPDAVTFSALVGAYERCGQWHAALATWEMMQASGFHPDAALYHSLLEVLWNSGLMLAQVRALQLWVTANRTSQIRIYTNTNSTTRALQYSMVTPKPGVAAITVLCWLLELRNKLFKDAANPAYPVVVTLQRAKASRVDSAPSMAAHEAVRSVLLGASCPFQVVLQPASTLLTANSDELLTWLRSNNFAELAHLLQIASSRQWTTEAMRLEDNATFSRCKEAYGAVCRLEAAHALNPSMYNLAVLQQRPQVVQLVLQYGSSFALREETNYDGLALFDRVMTSGAATSVHDWPLCLCSCLLLCARQSEGSLAAMGNLTGNLLPVWQSLEAVQALTGFAPDAIESMQRNVVMWLQGDLTVLSTLRVLLLYQERLGYFIPELRGADRTAGDMSALVSRTASSLSWLQIRPSLLAAGLLATLRNIKGILPTWPAALKDLTGFTSEEGELLACMAQVEAVLQ